MCVYVYAYIHNISEPFMMLNKMYKGATLHKNTCIKYHCAHMFVAISGHKCGQCRHFPVKI